MAYVFQTTDSINIIIADLVQSITGLADDKVLIQHSENGQPFQSIDQNVIYVETYVEQDIRDTFKNRHDKYDSETKTVLRTQQSSRTILVHLIMYGPESDFYISKINENMFFATVKEKLNTNNLFLIPERTEYQNKLFEKIGSRWWQRGDLKLRFYNTVIFDETINTIENVDYIIQEGN